VTFKSQAIVIGIPEQTESHSGDNIATQIISTIKDYGIQPNQIGYFMLDNATNNDTAMEAIADEFGFDAKQRRLRCAGHIINLIARSLLYGFDKLFSRRRS
jgi:type IV pilus biogenesis protein CpaD/CtpE